MNHPAETDGHNASKPGGPSRRQRNRERIRSYRPSLSSYVESVTVTLASGYAQRAYDLGLAPTAMAVFQIDVMLRVLAKKRTHLVKDFRSQLQQMLTRQQQELDEELARYERLLDDNGISREVRYTDPKQFTPQLFTPLAMDLVVLLEKMDRVLGYADKLHWNRVIDGDTWGETGIGWLRKIMACFRDVQGLHVRAKRALAEKKEQAQQRSAQPAEARATEAPETAEPSDAITSENAAEALSDIAGAETAIAAAEQAAPEAAAQLEAAATPIAGRRVRKTATRSSELPAAANG